MKKLFAIDGQAKNWKTTKPTNPVLIVNGKPRRLLGNGLSALFIDWPDQSGGLIKKVNL